MKYQCIDCKIEFIGKRKVCPQCKSRYIIFLEQKPQEHDEQSSAWAEENRADDRKQSQDAPSNAQARLKEGDVIKVVESVALVKMDTGDCYKVASIKMDYYEEIYCLSACDGNGVIEEGDTLEIPARSLDYWLDTDSIAVL